VGRVEIVFFSFINNEAVFFSFIHGPFVFLGVLEDEEDLSDIMEETLYRELIGLLEPLFYCYESGKMAVPRECSQRPIIVFCMSSKTETPRRRPFTTVSPSRMTAWLTDEILPGNP
jgi:hypothetical protein